MQFSDIQKLVNNEMEEVNDLINRRLYSKLDLVNNINSYITQSGGKRIRPMLVILTAKALESETTDKLLELSAIVEFIHTATLLHDDVIDGAKTRRGLQTAHTIWGSQASILVGDFLYSRSFQMMSNLQDLKVMEIMANTTNTIAEGEVLQLAHNHDPNTSEATYLEIIHLKTAELFKTAAMLGGVAAKCSSDELEALGRYGHSMGMVYQLIDDLLDYRADPEKFGKETYHDLLEGKPSLAIIYALQHVEDQQRELLEMTIRQPQSDHWTKVLALIQDSGAIDYVMKISQQEMQQAQQSLVKLPDSRYKTALESLIMFCQRRDY